MRTKPALELLDARAAGEAAFLVLDQDGVAGVDLRPHLPDRHGRYTAEPSPELFAPPAAPLPDLLEPLTLDSLTVRDGHRFLEFLAKQSNLRAQIAAEIPNLY